MTRDLTNDYNRRGRRKKKGYKKGISISLFATPTRNLLVHYYIIVILWLRDPLLQRWTSCFLSPSGSWRRPVAAAAVVLAAPQSLLIITGNSIVLTFLHFCLPMASFLPQVYPISPIYIYISPSSSSSFCMMSLLFSYLVVRDLKSYTCVHLSLLHSLV